MMVRYEPGNATIRTNPNPTSTSDFAILDFYVNGTGFHLTTTLPATDYTQLLSDSTPNELQTRHFLTPERQADVGCIRVTASETSVGEIVDVDFSLEIRPPRQSSPSPVKPIAGQAHRRSSPSPVKPVRLNFPIDSHAVQTCAPVAIRIVHRRRFTIPDPADAKNAWFVDFLSAAKKFDIRHIYFVIGRQAQGHGAMPEILKSVALHAVRAGDGRFAPMRLAEPAHANQLFDKILVARDASGNRSRSTQADS